MTLPNYKELASFLTLNDIEQELYILQKKLFDLRLKSATKKISQAHLFSHIKRRIAQLKFKQSFLANSKKFN